jgi:tRNA (cmo5U34)-methyltransferase
VLGDVITPEDPARVTVPLTPGFDKPSSVAEQVGWLSGAGFGRVEVAWERDDLAVLVADAAG